MKLNRTQGEYEKIRAGAGPFFIKWTAATLAAGMLLVFMPIFDSTSSSFGLTPLVKSDAPDIEQPPDTRIINKTIKKGDNVSRILRPYLHLKTILALEKKSRPVFSFTRFRRGNPYRIILTDGQFTQFEYEIDKNECLMIKAHNGAFDVKRVPVECTVQQQVVRVDIVTTLSDAVEKAGEDANLSCELSDIFAWDIDFIKDIKPGDYFQVLVEKRFRNDAFHSYGRILAAVFVSGSVEYKAFYYKGSDGRSGYYDEVGKSVQKAFLKSPVDYPKISSYFSTRRFHPILKQYRSHPGVDYAAPKNTPIKAVAQGKIIKIGYNRTMGRYITIRHFNGYETSYFHMNKYARGMGKNKTVNQGDIIGYVGKTGLATGYHLCFRMTKNGRPVNPLKHETPDSRPVSPDEREQFTARIEQYTERLLAAESIAKSTPN